MHGKVHEQAILTGSADKPCIRRVQYLYPPDLEPSDRDEKASGSSDGVATSTCAGSVLAVTSGSGDL